MKTGVTVVYRSASNKHGYNRLDGKEVIPDQADKKLVLIGFDNRVLHKFDPKDVIRIESYERGVGK